MHYRTVQDERLKGRVSHAHIEVGQLRGEYSGLMQKPYSAICGSLELRHHQSGNERSVPRIAELATGERNVNLRSNWLTERFGASLCCGGLDRLADGRRWPMSRGILSLGVFDGIAIREVDVFPSRQISGVDLTGSLTRLIARCARLI